MDENLEPLYQVFHALDTEKKGFITRDQFVTKFKNYLKSTSDLGAFCDDDLNDILSNLDPENDGIIEFEDFKKALSKSFYNKRQSMSIESNDTTLQFSSSCLTEQDADLRTDDSGVNCPHETMGNLDPYHSSWPKRGSPLHYNSRDGRISPTSNSQSDLLIDDVEVLRDQVRQMVEKMELLTSSNCSENDGRYRRVKEENDRLTSQLTILEERHKELEGRAARELASEKHHYTNIINRMEREHEAEIETLRGRYTKIETEYSQQRMSVIQLEAHLDVTKKELKRVTESLSEAQETINNMKVNQGLAEVKINSQIQKLRQERDQMVRELSHEMDEENATRIKGQIESSDALVRYHESQEVVRQLTEENKKLQRKLNEMQEELLSKSLEQGQELINRNSGPSLANELMECTREEIIEMLVREQQDNARLQDYIRRMLEKIVEKDPSILQV